MRYYVFWPYSEKHEDTYRSTAQDLVEFLSYPPLSLEDAAYRGSLSLSRLDEELWDQFKKHLEGGRPISKWPEVACGTHYPEDEPLPDVFYVWAGTRVFGVSARARHALEPYCRHDTQFLPFDSCREESEHVIRGLSILHVTRRLRALDPQRSTFFKDDRYVSSGGWYLDLDKPALIARRIKDAAIFRCHGVEPTRLFVREDVKKAVEKSGLSGFVFREVELVEDQPKEQRQGRRAAGGRKRITDRLTEYRRPVPSSNFTVGDLAEWRCLACRLGCGGRAEQWGECAQRGVFDGKWRVPWGYQWKLERVAILALPVVHILPGRTAVVSFGARLLKEGSSRDSVWSRFRVQEEATPGPWGEFAMEVPPERGSWLFCTVGDDALVAAEWCRHLMEAATQHGACTGVLLDVPVTERWLEQMRPVTKFLAFEVGGRTPADCEELWGSLRAAREMGYWVEVATPIGPKKNARSAIWTRISERLSAIDCRVPWHLLTWPLDQVDEDRDLAERCRDLVNAAAGTAREHGLKFVYGYGLSGEFDDFEKTFCPECEELVMHRCGDALLYCVPKGVCIACEQQVPGLWEEHPPAQYCC